MTQQVGQGVFDWSKEANRDINETNLRMLSLLKSREDVVIKIGEDLSQNLVLFAEMSDSLSRLRGNLRETDIAAKSTNPISDLHM